MRLRRTHYALAVVVVATALAADHAVAAAPQRVKPAQTSLARTFAARLTTQLQRSVPAVAKQLQPIAPNGSVAAPKLAIGEEASGVRSHSQPFQFRLPPPAL